jgi:hypothetical protein
MALASANVKISAECLEIKDLVGTARRSETDVACKLWQASRVDLRRDETLKSHLFLEPFVASHVFV